MNMNSLTQRLWRWSLRCYRSLLRVYPREFRNEFGEQLDQSFRDLARQESRRGWWGVARLWVRVLPDLAYSAIVSRQTNDLGWRFRFRWMVACALGYVLFPWAHDVVRYFLGFPFYLGDVRPYVPSYPPPQVFGAIAVLIIAAFQAVVLSNDSLDRRRWVLFSVGCEVIVSTIAGVGVFSRQPSMAEIIGIGACAATFMGLAQSLALRFRRQQMLAWVTAVAVAQVAMTLFNMGIQPILPTLADSGLFLVSNLTFLRALVQASIGLVGGTITAGPLEWILRTRPRPQES
jgi:hypothetical protein